MFCESAAGRTVTILGFRNQIYTSDFLCAEMPQLKSRLIRIFFVELSPGIFWHQS
jgi:hypothetical protein